MSLEGFEARPNALGIGQFEQSGHGLAEVLHAGSQHLLLDPQ